VYVESTEEATYLFFVDNFADKLLTAGGSREHSFKVGTIVSPSEYKIDAYAYFCVGPYEDHPKKCDYKINYDSWVTSPENAYWVLFSSNYDEVFLPQCGKFIVSVHSPVNALITAPDGKRVGFDPLTQAVVNEIEGATYSGSASEPQLITLPSPMLGLYTVDLFSIETGPYTLTIQSLPKDSLSIETQIYAGEIVIGANYVYSVSFTDGGMTTSPNPTKELQHLSALIGELPANCFDKPSLASLRKNALFAKIYEVILKVEAGNYTDAINKLSHDIRTKMDGDRTAMDWITDPTTQFKLCTIIDHIISNIQTLQEETG